MLPTIRKVLTTMVFVSIKLINRIPSIYLALHNIIKDSEDIGMILVAGERQAYFVLVLNCSSIVIKKELLVVNSN